MASEIISSWIGKEAPAINLPDQDGKVRQLDQYRGKYVALFWYPKDDTPGCTKEACGFRDLHKEFDALGVTVLGVSILKTKSKAKFAKKHNLRFPLLADEDHAVADNYKVWVEKSMYGRKYMGISRETFIIDPTGKIAMHWPKASGSETHAVEVLDWFRSKKLTRKINHNK